MRRYSNLMFFVTFEYQYKQNFDLVVDVKYDSIWQLSIFKPILLWGPT